MALRNALKNKGNYDIQVKNIRINGNLRGCSGFITNKDNNVVLYVDTEGSVYSDLFYMSRYAKNVKDYSGCTNCWNNDVNDYYKHIASMLQDEPTYRAEIARTYGYGK